MAPRVEVQPVERTARPASSELLQTRYWADVKSRFGWNASFFLVSVGERPGEHTLLLTRSVGPGLMLGYVPFGPAARAVAAAEQPAPERATSPESAQAEAAGLLREVAFGMRSYLARTPVCIRFDLPWPRGTLTAASRVRKAPVDVQPPDTTVVDLTRTEAEILSQMRSRSRRNIRKSERSGVVVRASQDVDEFYSLYETTAERDRIAVHSREYYDVVMRTADRHPDVDVELLVAEYGGSPIAAVIVAYTADRATYLYGASSNEHRETMPAYALQWEAMRRAKGRGAVEYDLFGIPPTDDPDHPMHGLYRFKMGFGGAVVHREGCWDVTLRPTAYSLYREAERVRQFYYKRLKKSR